MMTTMTTLILQGAALTSIAWLAATALRGASASTRHLIWASAVAALVVLPVAQLSGVRIEVPVPAWLLESEPVAPPTAVATAVAEPVVPAPTTSSTPATRRSAPERSATVSRAAIAPEVVERAAVEAPSVVRTAELDRGVTAGPEVSAAPAPVSTPTAPLDWAAILVGLWLAGSLLLIGATARGHLVAAHIVRSGRPQADPSTARLTARLAVAAGLGRAPKLVISDRMPVPAIWGFGRTAILLPAGFEDLPRARQHRILSHEIAHVARRDCWTDLIGSLARALHWPNPLAWLAVRRLRAESERACDDRVLEAGVSPSDYADDLVGFARRLTGRSRNPAAVLAMADSSRIGTRVSAILDPNRARRRAGRRWVAVGVSSAAALAILMAGFTPVAQAQERPTEPPPPPPAELQPERVAVAEPDPEPLPDPVPEPSPEPVEPEVETPRELVPAPSPRWVGTAAVTRPLARWITAVAPQSRAVCAFESRRNLSTSVNVDGDRMRVRWERDDCRVQVEIEGDVEFASDDSDVVAMSRRAYLEIEERDGRATRRVLIEADDSGELERRYWSDGDEQAWGPEARTWLAQVLPELFQRTMLNAEPRVRRMLAEGGPERVFTAVESMDSDHVVRGYLVLLMEHGDLDESDYVTVIDLGAELDSDHLQAELLLAVVEEAGMRPAFQNPLLEAAANLESDHQMSRVLTRLLETDLSPEQLDRVVRTAAALESDHQLAMVLSAVAEQGGLGAAGRDAFMETLATIESDHQHVTVLDAFLDAGQLTDQELTQVLEMSRGLESDHQRAGVLQRIAEEYELSRGQVDAYLRAASEIESDHQAAGTAIVILESSSLSDEGLEVVLGIVDGIDSDHQRAAVLHRVIDQRRFTDEEFGQLLAMARGIGSDHQLAAVLVQLVVEHGDDLSRPVIDEVLDVAGRIGSDHQQVSVLRHTIDQVSLDADQREEIRRLAAEMSRHQEQQVLAALGRQNR